MGTVFHVHDPTWPLSIRVQKMTQPLHADAHSKRQLASSRGIILQKQSLSEVVPITTPGGPAASTFSSQQDWFNCAASSKHGNTYRQSRPQGARLATNPHRCGYGEAVQLARVPGFAADWIGCCTQQVSRSLMLGYSSSRQQRRPTRLLFENLEICLPLAPPHQAIRGKRHPLLCCSPTLFLAGQEQEHTPNHPLLTTITPSLQR